MFRLSSRDTPSDERAYDESQNDNRDPQRGVRGEEQDEVPKPAGEREESDPVTAERGFRHPAELGLLENVRLRLDRKHHLDGRVRNPMFELPHPPLHLVDLLLYSPHFLFDGEKIRQLARFFEE